MKNHVIAANTLLRRLGAYHGANAEMKSEPRLMWHADDCE